MCHFVPCQWFCMSILCSGVAVFKHQMIPNSWQYRAFKEFIKKSSFYLNLINMASVPKTFMPEFNMSSLYVVEKHETILQAYLNESYLMIFYTRIWNAVGSVLKLCNVPCSNYVYNYMSVSCCIMHMWTSNESSFVSCQVIMRKPILLVIIYLYGLSWSFAWYKLHFHVHLDVQSDGFLGS